jgi:hypothetical protein
MRWLLVMAVVVAGMGPVEAQARRKDASQGGIRIGMEYFTGFDRELTDFLYPSFGWTYDFEDLYTDGQAILPWGLFDIVGGLFTMGRSDGEWLPIWNGLNGGDQNPGRVRYLHLTARYAFWKEKLRRGKRHKLDAGLLLDVGGYSPHVYDRNVGLFGVDLGAAVGYGFHSEWASFNLALTLGNGFNNLSNWTPFAGVDGCFRFRFHDIVGAYVKVMFREMRLDTANYEPTRYDDVPASRFDVRRWHPMLGFDVGLYFNVFD